MKKETIIQALRTLQFQDEDIINYMLIMYDLEIDVSKLYEILKDIKRYGNPMKKTSAENILNLETEAYMPRNLRLYGNVYIGRKKDGNKIRKELKRFGIETIFNKDKYILEMA